ncbi:MAG TPA: L,D-transpeptidase family protein [Allosphingosinicella sp.]|nr:L,D-transpeptidase family protein [Allosphingosinicella sp.]
MGRKIWLAAALIALAGCEQQQQQQNAQAPDGAAELRAAASDPRVAGFYRARGWRTAWTRESEAALTAAIGEAERHALDPAAFLGPVRAAASPAARDAALSLAALTYAEALARGRTDPARIRRPYTLPRPGPDLARGLERALGAGGDVGAWLRGLAPHDEEYRLLSEAYVAANRQVVAAQGRPPPALLDRARSLAVNLERRRWLEREPPATRIDVNSGAATLAYIRDGAVADSRRVVVGEPGRETPELASPLYRLVANPTWTVPRSIEQSEIVPKGEAYMRRNHMERRDGWIVQQSGPRNSLGLVKFDLRNDEEIYLHDTPAKALFRESDRHASHGCVRVQDALGFAAMIAADAGVEEAWREALAKGEETFVALPRPIPVRLFYHTAFVDHGRIVFAPDAYGWDEDVAEGLGLPRRPRPAAAVRGRDLGP